MNETAAQQRHFEQNFLAQLTARAEQLVRGNLPADEVQTEPTGEGIDDLREQLARLEVFDRDALDRLPGTRALEMRFRRRVLGGLLRETIARVRVRVLTDTEALVRGREPGPVTREQVELALARYQLLPKRLRPTGVLLASPTGFTEEARALVESTREPTLVLLGGREDGGWDLTMPKRVERSNWAALFELESFDARLRRLLSHLEQQALELDSRGIPLARLAQRLGLPVDQTQRLVHQAARQDPRLFVVAQDGQLVLCRTPIAMEGPKMTLWTRIRRWLGFKPTVAEQVRELTSLRVRLEQQRHELDQRLERLEAQEREALAAGARAPTDAEKRQIAGRLIRLRRELKRVRAQTQLLTNQIDVIGTQIHHLTLAEQGRQVQLPSAEQLTQQAAEAEQIMAQASTNAELAHQIEVTGETPLLAEEEEAIFAEFEQAAAARPAEPARQPVQQSEQSATPAADTSHAAPEAPSQPAAEPPPAPDAQRADKTPEPGE